MPTSREWVRNLLSICCRMNSNFLSATRKEWASKTLKCMKCSISGWFSWVFKGRTPRALSSWERLVQEASGYKQWVPLHINHGFHSSVVTSKCTCIVTFLQMIEKVSGLNSPVVKLAFEPSSDPKSFPHSIYHTTLPPLGMNRVASLRTAFSQM